MVLSRRNEMRASKTRFRSRDRSKEARSSCSPRLKSFPAEKIRKLNNSSALPTEPIGALILQQDPRETGTFFVGCPVGGNNDSGDATAAQLPPMHQQPKSCDEDTFGINRQQVAADNQHVNEASPQFESSPIQRVAPPEEQTRLPFTPSPIQATVIREQSPGNSPATIDQPQVARAAPTRGAMQAYAAMQQSPGESRAIVAQDRAPGAPIECDKSFHDRNSANRAQTIAQRQRQTIARDADASLDDRSANNCQAVHPRGPHQSHDPCRQVPRQQACQQSLYDACHRQASPRTSDRAQPTSNQQNQSHNNSTARNCDCCNRRFLAARFPSQGMTSPQDMTMRLARFSSPARQRHTDYSVNLQPHSPPSWPQNDRWMRATGHNQQCSHQQQYRYEMPSPQSPDSNGQSQDRSSPPRNPQTSQEPVDRQSRGTGHGGRRSGERKTAQFTPDMIRDQELLVATMKQQGVPDEVMRRQFDALMNEQRRHLAYVAQFQKQEDAPEITERRQYRLVGKRGAERDEKPDWMINITPSHVSYGEVERMRAQQRVSKDRCPMNEQPSEKVSRMMPARQQEETVEQSISPQQAYIQMNPHQMWQQQQQHQHQQHQQQQHQQQQQQQHQQQQQQQHLQQHQQQHQQQQQVNCYRNDRQAPPCGHAAYYVHPYQQNAPSNEYRQSRQGAFNGYSRHQSLYQHPRNVHFELPNAWSPNEHNPNSRDPTDDRVVATDPARLHERNERESESSSLLKMRVYKETIRPQRRNNGLQDPETVQKTLEMLKDPASRKGLEYLVNLAARKPTVRLNGIQEPGEVPADLPPRPLALAATQIRARVPANGLENVRNPNNPPPRSLRPVRIDESPAMAEYPRQKQQNPRTCYSVQAERENGTIAAAQRGGEARAHVAESIPREHRQVHQFDAGPHHHCHQRYYLNGHGGSGGGVVGGGGQGDVASTQRPDAPGATRIDRAGGDTGENCNAEETAKRVVAANGARATLGPNVYAQSRGTGALGCAGCEPPAGKPDCARNDTLVVSPDKLIASRHLQPPMIL